MITNMNNESALNSLEPIPVWQYFSDICNIPHTSGNEKNMGDFLIEFARVHNLECHQSNCGNVFIKKAATSDKVGHSPVILQAHMDMVGVKNDKTEFDFSIDPIKPVITDDGFVTAENTTLGADNGIGMAIILAILAGNNISHPEIHALFTVAEETSMGGAVLLTPDDIDANLAINIDSEDLGEICVGCAGGSGYTISTEPDIAAVPDTGYDALVIRVYNGVGGHSGIDINKKRLNAASAILAMINFLKESDIDVHISDISSGTVKNSIPSEGYAVICLQKHLTSKALTLLQDFALRLQTRYTETDPNISFEFSKTDNIPDFMTTEKATENILTLQGLNTKIMEYVPGTQNPMTSCNLGRIHWENNKCTFSLLARFATSEGKNKVESRINELVAAAGAVIDNYETYVYWEPDFESHMLSRAVSTYHKLTGNDSVTTVIHAGLECGLFKKLNPKLDIISIGPDIYGAHSCNEKVRISSVAVCFEWIKLMLADI